MDEETIKLLNRVWRALNWLIDECETNYLFGEDEGEVKALDNAKDKLTELTILLYKIDPRQD